MIKLIGKYIIIGGVATTLRVALEKHLPYNSFERKVADFGWGTAIAYSTLTTAYVVLEELTK